MEHIERNFFNNLPYWAPGYLEEDLVNVERISGKPYSLLVKWKPQPEAVKYKLYGAYYPERPVEEIKELTETEYEVFSPLVFDQIYPFFWVSKINKDDKEVFINTIGESIETFDPIERFPTTESTNDFFILNDPEFRFYIYEMRNRTLSAIDSAGEDFRLYLRNWYFTPCKCVPDESPYDLANPFQGQSGCDKCFSTGIWGGFFPHIKVKATFGPRRIDIIAEEIGIRPSVDILFTLGPFPRIRKFDLVERVSTGERFFIRDPNQALGPRGAILCQPSSVTILEQSHPFYRVTDARIISALRESRDPKFDRISWNIFEGSRKLVI